MTNRDELEQQLKDLEAQKVTLFDSGSADQVEVGRINEKIKGIQQQLSELDTQEIIYATAEEITTSIETFVVGDTTFTLDQLVIDEDCAKILRNGLKTISKTQAQKFLDEIDNQKSVYEMHLSLKQEQVNGLISDREELQNTNAQLQLEKDDLFEKRDAAAQQLLEAQAEIARLNSHVDDLRKEIAVGASNAPNVIDITSDADLEAAAQRLKAKKEQEDLEKRAAKEAARIKIYNVKQLDGTGATFGANRADNDEYITFGWLEKANFIELSDEDAARFRNELEAAKADIPEAEELDQDNLVVEDKPTIPVPTFPTEVSDADNGSQLGGDTAETESVQNHDGGSVEERLAALELAVFGSVKAAA